MIITGLAKSYVFQHLQQDAVYKVQVQYRTMFGIVGESNIIEVVQGTKQFQIDFLVLRKKI